jgi:hypothetical protein
VHNFAVGHCRSGASSRRLQLRVRPSSAQSGLVESLQQARSDARSSSSQTACLPQARVGPVLESLTKRYRDIGHYPLQKFSVIGGTRSGDDRVMAEFLKSAQTLRERTVCVDIVHLPTMDTFKRMGENLYLVDVYSLFQHRTTRYRTWASCQPLFHA